MKNDSKSYWFVGASFGSNSENQTAHFLSEGIWQNKYQDKYLDLVRLMKPGDQIAIKSSYTRKSNLPFENHGHAVAVMGIKAIGVIKENQTEGRCVIVDWEQQLEPAREWYLYTTVHTVWRIESGEWRNDDLINFTFSNGNQNIDRFRNAPYWRERFGDIPLDEKRFNWTQFYEAIADNLLKHKDNRGELIAFVKSLADRLDISYIKGKQLDDICPLTVMGMFNRGITDVNRQAIAKDLADFLEVKISVPDTFEGIPILNNQKSWFFGSVDKRQSKDIDALWNFFEKAIQFSDNKDDSNAKTGFSSAYDRVVGQPGAKWNLTMALYWIRAWDFLTLDKRSRSYLDETLGIKIKKNSITRMCDSKNYLSLIHDLKTQFQEENYPVHSFPELSYKARFYKDGETIDDSIASDIDNSDESDDDVENEFEPTHTPIEPYFLDDIITDGCFINREKLARIIDRLRSKKNLILQGPPGTGKTWLAKRLAFALMGQKNVGKLRALQFHPNLSYEDFVRGWRPSGEGKLTLIDGPFLEMVNKAKNNASAIYVMVIEEINRGNPAQIFGEMLTLLEADKRTPAEALELSYRREESERIYVPDNLYVIGTMNIADRSLALVDFALRRRFAFIDLEPVFGSIWRKWVHDKSGIELGFLKDIEQRLMNLNSEIEADRILGPQFKIGHSYVTPASNDVITDAIEWYKGVVETEIGPLLNEYWFDDPERAKNAQEKLIQGL